MGRVVKHTVRPDAFLKSGALANTAAKAAVRKWPCWLVKCCWHYFFTPPRVSAAAAFTRKHEPVKPPVPKRTEAPTHGLSSGKDFVVHNAVEAILTVPKARGKDVDEWLAKPDYGRVPEYLSTIKAQIQAEQEFVQRMLDQHQASAETSEQNREKRTAAIGKKS